MGHYIVKFNHKSKTLWGVKQGENISPFKEQPQSLRQLIEEKERFLKQENLDLNSLAQNEIEFLAPVSSPCRVVCQGLNYASHREESGLAKTAKSNVLFGKDESSITGANSPIMRPKDCECLDYEVELGLIIKKDISTPLSISDQNLHEYVAGIVLANDMSPRDLQYKDDHAQWYKAKSARTMLPLGPVLYLMEEADFEHLLNLDIKLWWNNDLKQNSNTGLLIFKPAETLTEISSFMNLAVGDILLTGTPGGVIVKPPKQFKDTVAAMLMSREELIGILREKKGEYLQDGDVIKTNISSPDGSINLGFQTNKIVPYGF